MLEHEFQPPLKLTADGVEKVRHTLHRFVEVPQIDEGRCVLERGVSTFVHWVAEGERPRVEG